MTPFFPLFLIVLFSTFSYSAFITILNIFFLSNGGSTSWNLITLTFFLSLYPLGQFVGSPFLTAYSEKWGIKKVLLFSLTLSTFLLFLIALSFEFFFLPLLAPLIFLAGMSDGTIVLAQNEFFHPSLKREQIPYFNHLYTACAFGLILGPLISAELMTHSLSTPFWILACCFLTLIFITAYYQEKDTPFDEYHHPKINLKKSFTFFKLFKNHLRRSYAAIALIYLSIFLFIRSYPIIIINIFGFDIALLDELIAFLSVLIVLTSVLIIKPLSKKIPPKRLTILFSILLSLAYLLMTLPSTTLFLWILLALILLSLSITLALASSLICDYPNELTLKNNLLLIFLCEALSCIISGPLILIYPFLPILLGSLFSLSGALLIFRTPNLT